ncbi:Ig-like domain-containing protein [Vibrio sp. Isolate23]|uniref:Ig-like domain-containing protein n=1 Tax=Vibrio sp. Isolate23 TaxID=2908533 RepID=UPI001EFCD8CE|nr:Ig-like domain-containing protein [Vibrio sp. Isolate23]MCG9683228.1 Ig-like domain-containing protein [Vibrio sp. Isolate23]
MRKLNILAISLSAAFMLAGCDGEESTTENIAVEVPFSSNSIPMPNDGYGYDEDGTISLPNEPSSIQNYSTREEFEAYYQSFETSFAAVDGWGLCVEPIEIPLDSVNSGQVPAIDPSSLVGNVLLLDSSGNEIDGTKLTSDGRQLTIQCSAALQPGTSYYLAVTNGVKTTQGTPLQPSSGFTQLLNTSTNELDEHEQWLQSTTQEAVDVYHTTGNPHSLVYAAKFTTQNSYAIIDTIVEQTRTSVPAPRVDMSLSTEDHKIDIKKGWVIVSTKLTTNNYLPFTQEIADSEGCTLDRFDPIASCPSMYRWMTGENGEALTKKGFEENDTKIQVYNDSSTLIDVDFYLPKNDDTNTPDKAASFIEDLTNPVVIFNHGITADRTSAELMAKKYTDNGYIVAAIDMPYHGSRIVNDSNGLPISAAIDKSYFINISSPLALRANLHQGVSDFIGLRWALNFGHPDREVHLVGHSLGGIMSVMTTEATFSPGGTTAPSEVIEGLGLKTSTFAVPGQGLVNVTLSSLTLGPEMEQSVKKSPDVQRGIAETLLPNLCQPENSNQECIEALEANSDALADSITMLEDEIYAAVIPVLRQGVQQTIDSSDPAGKVTRQRIAKQPTLLIEAKGACGSTCEPGEYMPDTVVPNSADNNTMTGTEPLIQALGLDTILDTTNESNGIRGVIRTTVGGHGTYLFPYEGPMDEETGFPSADPKYMPEGKKSKTTQQDAVLDMVVSKGQYIIIKADDRDSIYDNQEVTQ